MFETIRIASDFLRKRRRNRKLAPLMNWRYAGRPDGFDYEAAYSTEVSHLDKGLMKRILNSTKSRIHEVPTDQWAGIYKTFHGDIVKAIEHDDIEYLSTMINDPIKTDLFYGFEALSKTLRKGGLRIEDEHCPSLAFDGFKRLGEALGVLRMENPEKYTTKARRHVITPILDAITKELAVKIQFPNPFPGEYGLVTDYGIATERTPQAIYQAWRVKNIGGPVVEIGGGLGRTAYFARCLGVLDYTIVDIPITAIAQAAFLMKSGVPVTLPGEQATKGSIRLIGPEQFFSENMDIGVVLNVDSLTELGTELGRRYAAKIADISDVFLSINHEANADTVRELMLHEARFKSYTRAPSWLRNGYVEEQFLF